MITSQYFSAPAQSADPSLLIMLPGMGFTPTAFAEHGMIAAIHAHNPYTDIITVDPDVELYLDHNIAATLHGQVIAPALAKNYTNIWLLGISLGGMGALLYAAAHPAEVQGLILLAPFLGTGGTIAEITKAGSFCAWSAKNSAATDLEQRAVLWLQTCLAQPETAPDIYLGYADGDRFAAGHRLLAAALPQDRVATTSGGHDWVSWHKLLLQILHTSPFTANSGNIP